MLTGDFQDALGYQFYTFGYLQPDLRGTHRTKRRQSHGVVGSRSSEEQLRLFLFLCFFSLFKTYFYFKLCVFICGWGGVT